MSVTVTLLLLLLQYTNYNALDSGDCLCLLKWNIDEAYRASLLSIRPSLSRLTRQEQHPHTSNIQTALVSPALRELHVRIDVCKPAPRAQRQVWVDEQYQSRSLYLLRMSNHNHLHELGLGGRLAWWFVSLSCILRRCTTARFCFCPRAWEQYKAVLFWQIAHAHGCVWVGSLRSILAPCSSSVVYLWDVRCESKLCELHSK